MHFSLFSTMKSSLNVSWHKIALVVLLLVLGVEFGILGLQRNSSSLQEISLEQYAATILVVCENTGYRPACYDQEISKLMDERSMEQHL